MGLLDILKKKEQKQDVDERQKLPYNINLKVNEEGKLQIDFHENKPDFKQFYDTTRLIVDGERTDIGGIELKDCRVSWYGDSDVIMFDRETGEEISRRTNYKNVLADIDIKLLQSDYNYCAFVMKGLLNEKRVERYLNDGLKEQPEIACGRYVGGIRNIENRYTKYFDQQTGKLAHNSADMKNKRSEIRIQNEGKRQELLRVKQEELAKLQSEIDELSR